MSSSHNDNLPLLQILVDTLNTHNLTAVCYKHQDLEITIEKQQSLLPSFPPPPSSPSPPSSHPPSPSGHNPQEPSLDESKLIRSGLVGTVYLSPSPDVEPFVKPGDTVKEGDVVLIIEAMKVMNNITAPRNGTIKDILVGDAEPVEYNQPLALFD